MGKKTKAVILRNSRPILLAALASSGVFLLCHAERLKTPELLMRPALLAAGLFILLAIAFGLFAASVRRQVALELRRSGSSPNPSRMLRLFVFYKEGVKAVFGVSLMLGWIAGMLFIVDHFQEAIFLVPLLLGLAYSALLYFLVFSFATLLDHIPYPFGGE